MLCDQMMPEYNSQYSEYEECEEGYRPGPGHGGGHGGGHEPHEPHEPNYVPGLPPCGARPPNQSIDDIKRIAEDLKNRGIRGCVCY